jgi:shikimate dehydrogenase
MNVEFGLVGKKLGHSFSRTYFTQKFHAEKIDARYENFELEEISMFKSLKQSHPQLRGLNVTIPYKETIISHLDELSPNATAIGAVNTVHFKNGRAIGHNTDVIGFRDSLAEVYRGHPGGRALILGTGGSAKAVRYVLQHYFEFEGIWNVSRTPRDTTHISYATLAQSGLQDCRLIVNCTPIGMYPAIEGLPNLPYTTLSPDCLVFDLVYNPEETKLLATARTQGCPTRNGMDMLLRQAEASWQIWMG